MDELRDQFREEESSIDIKSILGVVWGMKCWILLCLAVCMIIAYCYIKATRTQYTSNATIMLVNQDNTSVPSELAVLSEITGTSGVNKVANEVVILQSRPLMQKVVEELDLNYSYYKSRQFKKIEYYGSRPFNLTYIKRAPEASIPSVHIVFEPKDSVYYRISSITVQDNEYPMEDKNYRYSDTIPLLGGGFYIEPAAIPCEYGDKYEVSFCDPSVKAKSLARSLTVSYDKTNDIIQLSCKSTIPARGEDMLNTLINKYNEEARLFNNKATTNTLTFLDERLALIERELGSIDTKYQDFRRSNTLIDVASQSQITLTTDEKYQAMLSEVDVQLSLLSIVKEYVYSMGNEKKVIPANIGITDIGLNNTIDQFNKMVMERNRMVANSSTSNPLVISADNQISELLSSIDVSVKNLDKSYKIQRNSIEDQISQGKKKLSAMPGQQLELTQFSRQQEIKEPLYILLQQKREEAMISLFSISDQSRIIESATGTSVPTSPNKKMVYAMAIILGFIMAPCYFFLTQAFKTTIDGKKDVTDRTNIPILASIPITNSADKLMRMASRNPVAEAMRMLRSNLRYTGQTVFQVTSSLPEEGKSFISTNLAIALAHVGKKVLLLGADLRKPRLRKMFGVERDRNKGVVPYIIGLNGNLESSIYHNCADIDNLDVLFSGPVPPNPSELLESDKMSELMNALRGMNYDYIIIDSSPYLPVADATTVDRYVDANIFVLRAGVADLKFIKELDNISKDGKLKNIALVLNGVDTKSRAYGYYYGYGYGRYGYGNKGGGYGYGYGYGDKPKESKE